VLLGELVAWLVVTDREAIRDAIYDCRAAVEANDRERLLSHVAPKAALVRADIRSILDRIEVTMARVSDLEIKVNRQADPRVANAAFTAIGRVRDRKGQFPMQPYGCKLIVDWRKEAGRWLVVDYRIEDLKGPNERAKHSRP
jgi:ketosteroid isomerase-like protein